MSEIYLKIYIENGDTIVFEGQGTDDKDGYVPVNNNRVGTVVIGKEHVSITDEAKGAFKKILMNAPCTGDDIGWLYIWGAYGKNPDGSKSKDRDTICVSYMGNDVVMKYNIEDAILGRNGFCIGIGEGKPDIKLLDKLSCNQLQDVSIDTPNSTIGQYINVYRTIGYTMGYDIYIIINEPNGTLSQDDNTWIIDNCSKVIEDCYCKLYDEEIMINELRKLLDSANIIPFGYSIIVKQWEFI